MSDFKQQAFHDACCQGEPGWMKDQGLGAALEIERLRVELAQVKKERKLAARFADDYLARLEKDRAECAGAIKTLGGQIARLEEALAIHEQHRECPPGDVCDCDERCNKCGKKKRRIIPNPTWDREFKYTLIH